MNPAERQPDPLLVVRIVWGATAWSPVVFAAVAFLIAGGAGPADADSLRRIASGPVAVVLFVAGMAACAAGFRVNVDFSADSAESAQERIRRAMTPFMVRCALFDATGVLGLLVSILTGAPLLGVPFWLLALAGFAASFPKGGGR